MTFDFIRLRGRALVCIKKNENLTFCEKEIYGDEKPVVGDIEVCAVCRMGALAEGTFVGSGKK